MGRDAGYIALHSGIATGAENILIPETETDIEELIQSLSEQEKRKKLVNIIVVAEGDKYGANEISSIVKKRLPSADTRVCILGHIQRGCSPTCLDRLIASRMGFAAVECLLNGTNNVMVGILNNQLHYTPLDHAIKAKQKISEDWLRIVKILAS